MTEDALTVMPAGAVARSLARSPERFLDVVEGIYRDLEGPSVVNPHSLFLRSRPDAPERIIALPAHVAETVAPTSGIKWISSSPANVEQGLPRASAVVVLNDPVTGRAYAVLEGAQISTMRTALSAAVGARLLHGTGRRVEKLAVVGTGPIAAASLGALRWAAGLELASVAAFDLARPRAERFVGETGVAGATVAGSVEETLDGADVVLVATSAVEPTLAQERLVAPGVTVLHMSLRDIVPDLLPRAVNYVDDVDHALREGTSLQRAVAAGLCDAADVIPIGRVSRGLERDPDRAAVFAPFGMGALDVALARLVFEDEGVGPDTVRVEAFHPV